MLRAFFVICGLELLLWLPTAWHLRKFAAWSLIAANSVILVALLVVQLKLWAALVAVIGIYRLINLYRILRDRTQPDYLYHSSKRTALWLIGSQIIVMSIAWITSYVNANQLALFYLLTAGQVGCGMVLLASTLRHIRTTEPPVLTKVHADKDLPSLTVAIPARNETIELEACLKSLIASSYPKLEILVLDDCSQNKHTPEIMRSFAHDGVRFIAGQEPPDKWLAKNYGYHQLAEASSGELLLFCGVDVRFEPRSLNTLVETLLHKQKSMISLLPSNPTPASWGLTRLITQPNRYAWELALPRRLFRRPPVLSTCWLVTRQALQASGGFAAVSRQTVPESYFARQIANTSDGYSFLQSSTIMGVSSHKSAEEQQATAIRTRYPQLHRRLEMTLLVSLAEFTALVWPLIIFAASLLAQEWALAALAGLAWLLQSLAYSQIVNLTYRQFLLSGTWLVSLAALHDIWLLNYSMWQYEFSEVIWKGRNICIPVMRVIPNLPKA